MSRSRRVYNLSGANDRITRSVAQVPQWKREAIKKALLEGDLRIGEVAIEFNVYKGTCKEIMEAEGLTNYRDINPVL